MERTKAGFGGKGVLALESRLLEVMRDGIQRHGGRPVCAPSMQEIPLDKNPELTSFGEKLISGDIHILVLLTGVGTRYMLENLSRFFSRDAVLTALSKVTIVARGPKPVQTLLEWKLKPSITVPEPNTWHEIIESLDYSRKGVDLEGSTVAVQEYGVPNPGLIAALKKKKANVIEVPVYRWALPDDKGPLRKCLEEIQKGSISFALFTNTVQIRHLLRVAAESGSEAMIRESFRGIVVSSIGPACSEALRECGIGVDFEPSHPKMGHLLAETAREAERLLEEKGKPGVFYPRRAVSGGLTGREQRKNSIFMKACRLEPVETTPIWLMRQAGRYMKEYRDLRRKVGFLELCKNPELCAQVTIHAQETLGVDAAIIFSDLLLVLEPMGLGLEYTQGDGPSISADLQCLRDVERLREVDPEESLNYVLEAVRLTRESLQPGIPLLGFAGAPFTLASYVVEGGPSKYFIKTKQLMYTDLNIWTALMEKMAKAASALLLAQIDAGADAVQVFDSWVGCLSPEEYEKYVLPHTKRLIESLPDGVPVIHFTTGTGTYIDLIRKAGGDIISIDSRLQIDRAWEMIGHDAGLQGNLDPVVLHAPMETIRASARRVLDAVQGRPGHIFNLGHGVLPSTPVENVRALVEFVHEYGAGQRSAET